MAEKIAEFYSLKKINESSIKLTGTEEAVLRLLEDGFTNKEIGESMNIKLTTVKFHVKNILNKLDVKSRTDAVKKAKETGLLIL